MAKHRKSSNFFAYRIEEQLALATLANGIALTGDLTALGLTKCYLISADLNWTIEGMTSGQGPIDVGVASGDLTATEIVESLDAKPTSRSDRIPMERSRRPVRRSGSFPSQDVTETLNDGKPIRTKLKFYIDEGIELVAWARNRSGATLAGGAVLNVTGNLFMKWA